MDGVQAEKLLAILYSSTAVASLTSLISFLVTWQHWTITLDQCISFNCGCILNGKSSFSMFMGGHVNLCHFGVYGLIPVIIIGAILGFYHGYRTCIPRGLSEPRAMASSRRPYHSRHSVAEGQVIVVGPKQRSPCKQWIPASVLGALLFSLSLAHALVLIDGYFETCKQYRGKLVELLNSTGRELQVIHYRLSCGTIFDYMDYLHPDTNNWRRGEPINTGLALQISMVTSWINFFAWAGIVFINISMARQRLKSLNEKICCLW